MQRLAAKSVFLAARAAILQQTRIFFSTGGYLEVDTPLLIPAPAPEAHIDAVPAGSHFLHTSPEICMKRLLAAGYPRLFQICHCWRQGERGSRHLPEFTMLEWYRAEVDYRFLMDECCRLIRFLAESNGQAGAITYKGCRVSLTDEWEVLTVREAFARYGEISMEDALAQGRFDEVMVEAIEPSLGVKVPTFICEYPAERGALARLKRDDPTVAERFELYISGIELANAFSELTDPVEQRQRFLDEAACRAARGQTPYPLPDKFLADLAFMPPAAGIALGMDRLVMLLANASTIDDIVPFTPEEL